MNSICFIALLLLPVATPVYMTSDQQSERVAVVGKALVATTQLPIQTIAKGYRSGVRTPLQVIARSQTEWDKLWQQHLSSETASPPPVIDFEKHIIVGLFLGDKPTGGYNVAITRAEQSDSDLIAYYEETLPRPGGIVIQTLTQPFHIVRVTRANYSNVIFRRLS